MLAPVRTGCGTMLFTVLTPLRVPIASQGLFLVCPMQNTRR